MPTLKNTRPSGLEAAQGGHHTQPLYSEPLNRREAAAILLVKGYPRYSAESAISAFFTGILNGGPELVSTDLPRTR